MTGSPKSTGDEMTLESALAWIDREIEQSMRRALSVTPSSDRSVVVRLLLPPIRVMELTVNVSAPDQGSIAALETQKGPER